MKVSSVGHVPDIINPQRSCAREKSTFCLLAESCLGCWKPLADGLLRTARSTMQITSSLVCLSWYTLRGHRFDQRPRYCSTPDTARDLLKHSRNDGYLVFENDFIESCEGFHTIVGDVSEEISEYINTKFPKIPTVSKKDFLFTCSAKANKGIHQVFAQFFSSDRLELMAEEASSLVQGSTTDYADQGVLLLLRNDHGNDLVDALRRAGYSEATCFSMLCIALDANRQIVPIIDFAWQQIKYNPGLGQAIVEEIEGLQARGLSFAQAAQESNKLRNTILEAVRFDAKGMRLRRHTNMGESFAIPQGSFAFNEAYVGVGPYAFNPGRFNALGNNHWPKLSFLPFGSGPNQCLGWRLPKIMITQRLAQKLVSEDFKRLEA
ncbi:MAG: cytochrome P450 [Chlamydiales bacterium]|nr:cytochrome P450 [Chlamydiales bacterium]